MYKIVIHVPESEGLDAEPWQETEDPHGPHIKVYHGRKCAETDEAMTIIRCKNSSLAGVVDLVRRVLPEYFKE